MTDARTQCVWLLLLQLNPELEPVPKLELEFDLNIYEATLSSDVMTHAAPSPSPCLFGHVTKSRPAAVGDA